jgi:hypothetical protein
MNPAVYPFIGIGIAIVVAILIVLALSRLKKFKSERTETLAVNGFVPCEDHEDYLRKMAHFLACDDPRNLYDYNVTMPMLNASSGEDVFYFWVQRRTGEDSQLQEETFLFPFKRNTQQPVAIYLSPKAVTPGLEKFLTNVLVTFTPGSMSRLELPPELQGGKILAALGPHGASIYDLLDSSTMSEVLSGVELGIARFRAYGEFACVVLESKYANPDINQVWQFVRHLAARK